jgi:hypothetical protein
MSRRPERAGLIQRLRARPRGEVGRQIFQASPGAPGADGRGAGLAYSFDTSTTMGDPGAGDIRFNNGTIASVTQLAISDTDDEANNLDGYLDQWDDSNSSIRGQIIMASADGQITVFNVNGAITDEGTWHRVPVAYVAGALFSADEAVKVLFIRAGDLGRQAGWLYTYDNDTANSDPGSGKLKFDSTTMASITTLRISETDGDGGTIGAILATWDDSNSTIKATLHVRQVANPAIYQIFQITGTLTDNGTWDSFPVTRIGGNGTLSDEDPVVVQVFRTGDGIEPPWTIHINPYLVPATATPNPWTIDAGAANGERITNGFLYNSPGAVNDEIGWDVVLAAGTWTFSLLYTKISPGGIITVSLDGSSLGTIDTYNAATTPNQRASITGISVASSGKKRLLLKMATKNASSSNYWAALQALGLIRTA